MWGVFGCVCVCACEGRKIKGCSQKGKGLYFGHTDQETVMLDPTKSTAPFCAQFRMS